MSRMLRVIATATAMAVGSVGVAQAAFVENIVGDVKVDFGQGFVPVKTPAALKRGDRVMAGPKSSAQIQYPGGCYTNVPVGKVITVGAENTCAVANVVDAGTVGESHHMATTIIAGGALIGGAALIIGSKKSSSSSP